MILIIGSEEEQHSKHVFNALKERKIKAYYFDSRKYTNDILLNYHCGNSDKYNYMVIENKKINLSDIQGVYWRWLYGIPYVSTQNGNEDVSQIVYKEKQSMLESFFLSYDKCNWVNSYKAIQLHKTKIHQLDILLKNNIRIPKTLATNDKNALKNFWIENNKNIIYKPLNGGAYTKKATKEDFKKENLELVKTVPIQAQEFIDGVDIRVYAIGNKTYAAEIRTNVLDYRNDKNATLAPVKLPKSVQKDCFKIMKLLNLKYSGIDIRKTHSGEYVFIEANPAPMFTYFEKITNYPITQELINLLIQ